MIEIYGASDDCVEVKGCEDDGEFYADSDGRWQGDLIGPDGPESMRIRAAFDPDGSGCWVISLSQTDESVPFPPWGNGVDQAPDSSYSTLIRVEAPDGTRLESADSK